MLSLNRPTRFKPRSPRTLTWIETRLILGDREVVLQIRDVSRRGFMAESQGSIVIGSEGRLALPGHDEIGVQIRWALGSRVGGVFDRPLNLNGLFGRRGADS